MFNQVLDFLDNSTWGVWGIPTMVIILGTGLLLTISLKGLQFRKLGYALRTMFRKPDGEKGEVSSFGALCTALSATIGTGNIVGVATALVAGGPGALFWMWVAALLGMATKYAECLVAIHYREQKSDGHILGGAFYAIEKGMGKNWKWLAILFALFGTLVGLFGIGTFSQVNSISSAINTFFDSEGKNIAFRLFGINYTYATVISSLVVAIFVALIIIGGLKRISKVATYIVPFMAILYFIFGVIILVTNAPAIPGAFVKIFRGAFGLDQVAGGAFGFMLIAMQKGIARGIFSNEAGLGSAPIAASAAQVKDPVQQAVISMTGTFFDTIVICTITGLAIVIAGSYDIGLKGYAVTDAAFKALLPFGNTFTGFVLMVSLVLFGFTTILGWDYYSERCIEYLSGGKMGVVKVYRWLYILAVFIGPYMTISQVWTIADIFNALMAIPNCICLIALVGVIAKLSKDFFAKKQ